MASLNKVMLIGNVTRDPEVKFTPKGSAVADLGLAINRSYTNQAGEKVEEVTYVDVELWGRLAEIAGEYAKKGRPIFIEGRLRMDSWEDKQSGQKRNRLKVVGEGLNSLFAVRGRKCRSRRRGCYCRLKAVPSSTRTVYGNRSRRRYPILILLQRLKRIEVHRFCGLSPLSER
jgi:single-strand DNA-binding protein